MAFLLIDMSISEGGIMQMCVGYLLVWISISLTVGLNVLYAGKQISTSSIGAAPFGAAQRVGRLQADRLVECSGIDVSMAHDDLLWAINDRGNGPYLFALGDDGRDRGRVRVAKAQNRDWEGLETFLWQDRPMILIADFGDNDRRHATHTLYVVEEPVISSERLHSSAVTPIAWRTVFTYPDHNHDAEGVAVDVMRKEVLIMTKRDDPPLLFALPLKPPSGDRPLVARLVAALDRIPPPSIEDHRQPFGQFRSQPTALDLSLDGLQMVVLTYKHAYLFNRVPSRSWRTIVGTPPIVIQLPLPQDANDLRQREAICFSKDGRSIFVTSEGKWPGLYQLKAR